MDQSCWAYETTGSNSRLQKITNWFKGICRIVLYLVKKIWKMSTRNWLTLETLGSQPLMPKNLVLITHLLQEVKWSYLRINLTWIPSWALWSTWKMKQLHDEVVCRICYMHPCVLSPHAGCELHCFVESVWVTTCFGFFVFWRKKANKANAKCIKNQENTFTLWGGGAL